MSGRQIGDVILDLQHISLRFGGVKALTDISFDVKEHEIRAIIGPNGAGKSSMLNVINGVYRPPQGTITFRGRQRRDMDTHDAAAQGIARTFQNIALFKGMTVLDNIKVSQHYRLGYSLVDSLLRTRRYADREKSIDHEAMELLDERGAPLMLQRRVQRLWKDLEQALAVGETGASALDRLRSECAEVLAEAGRERRN